MVRQRIAWSDDTWRESGREKVEESKHSEKTWVAYSFVTWRLGGVPGSGKDGPPILGSRASLDDTQPQQRPEKLRTVDFVCH